MAKTTLLIPTAINVVGMVNGAVIRNRRQGTVAEVRLPSLLQRARMVVNEEGVLPVQEDEVVPVTFITR